MKSGDDSLFSLNEVLQLRDVFRTHLNTYDEVILRKKYTAEVVSYFRKKSSIRDVEQGPKYTFVVNQVNSSFFSSCICQNDMQ